MVKITLYDSKLLDRFQLKTGLSDDSISAWLLNRETMYERGFSWYEWQSDPQWVYDYVHASVVFDINAIIAGHSRL